MVEVANANMLRALRLVSVERGYDLRDFALIAYGGAGPVHAGLLARQAGMTRVIVPVHSGTFSALGCLVSPLRYDAVQTWRARLDVWDPKPAEDRFQELEERCLRPLLDEGIAAGEVALVRSADLRYTGQNYELEVPWRSDSDALRHAFEARHRQLYGYATGESVECVNLRVVARVRDTGVTLPEPLRAARRRGGPPPPGAPPPPAHGRDGGPRSRGPQADPRRSIAPRRRLVPQPSRGGRQPPAGREGDPSRLRRRPARRVRHQPRPLGGHWRRPARQLRALGDRVLSGRPPHSPHPSLFGRQTRPGGDRPHPREPPRAGRGRGRHLRPVRRRRRRGPTPGRARRALRRRDAPRVLRRAPRGVGGADAGGAPRAPRRRLGGRGLARRRRRGRPAAPREGAGRGPG